jgi:glycosyltransferase involved in cell wall biosynthesis
MLPFFETQSAKVVSIEAREGKGLEQERHNYKISVIVPIYNGERNIPIAFGSIARQTIGFEHLEVIFVDDASTDGSAAILDSLASRYENVKTLRLDENSGYAGRPRNEGMREASADYLMFLDQDDVYYPEACEHLYRAIDEGGDIAGGYYSIYDHAGKVVAEKSDFYTKYEAFSVGSVDERPEILKFRVGIWTKIYRKATIRTHNIRFIEDIPVEDLVFFTELAMAARGFRYIDVPIVRYSLRDAADRSLTYRLDLKNTRAVGRGFEVAYAILCKYNRVDYYPLLAEGTTKFYMDLLLDNDLSEAQETAKHIEALRFIFLKAHEYRIFDGSGQAELLTALVQREEYELAAIFLREIRTLYNRNRRYEDLHNKLKYSRIFKVIGKIRGWETD